MATIRPLCFNADKAAAAARSSLVLDLLLINAYIESGEACLLAEFLLLPCMHIMPDSCMGAVQSTMLQGAMLLIAQYKCWPCCSGADHRHDVSAFLLQARKTGPQHHCSWWNWSRCVCWIGRWPDSTGG